MADQDSFVEAPDLDALKAAPLTKQADTTNPTAPAIKVGKSGVTYPSGNVPPGGELENFLSKLLPETFGAKKMQSGVQKLKDPNASSTGGMADLLEGAGQAGMMTVGLPEMATAKGLMALLGGLGGGFGGRRVATAFGADPESARLAGDVTGIGTGALASRVPASALELLKTGPLSKIALFSKLLGRGGESTPSVGTAAPVTPPAGATPTPTPAPVPVPNTTSTTGTTGMAPSKVSTNMNPALANLLQKAAPPTPNPVSTTRTATQLLTPQAPPAPTPVPGKSPSIVPNYAPPPAPQPTPVMGRSPSIVPNYAPPPPPTPAAPPTPVGTNTPTSTQGFAPTEPKMILEHNALGQFTGKRVPAPAPTSTLDFLKTLVPKNPTTPVATPKPTPAPAAPTTPETDPLVDALQRSLAALGKK